MYSEMATKFDEISKFYLKLLSSVKKVWIFHHIFVAFFRLIFVAFSEYINFTNPPLGKFGGIKPTIASLPSTIL
jgi:hypothetical protein